MGIKLFEILCKHRTLPRCDSLLLHHERLAKAHITDQPLQRADSLQLAKQRLAKQHASTQSDTASCQPLSNKQRDQAAGGVTEAAGLSTNARPASVDAHPRVVRITSAPDVYAYDA